MCSNTRYPKQEKNRQALRNAYIAHLLNLSFSSLKLSDSKRIKNDTHETAKRAQKVQNLFNTNQVMKKLVATAGGSGHRIQSIKMR